MSEPVLVTAKRATLIETAGVDDDEHGFALTDSCWA